MTATKKSIRLRILKQKSTACFQTLDAATKKSIRLRILKPQQQRFGLGAIKCYKKIDPFADTETPNTSKRLPPLKRYKKIDPFADTETRLTNAENLAAFTATKKSIRLRILKPPLHTILRLPRTSYKKIDPFADTETFISDTRSG